LREDGQPSLRRLLQEEGIGEAAALEVERYSEELRQLTVASGTEYAGMVDVDSGSRLGRTIRGSVSETDIRQHLNAMAAGHGYVQLHTHPRSAAFSWWDAALLLRFDSLQSMVVIGSDRRRFLLSRNPEVPQAKPEDVQRMWAVTFRNHWRNLSDGQIEDMSDGEVEAMTQVVTQAMWPELAADLGLRYAEIEGFP